ncbi:HlyD family efflux transporter periplasmic adaptor subunit [Bradyrhizobium sp. CSA207]|uniref:HlyD family secretion protein n=1 Tax=Bradyrhizobium sp. CSA207 TaxID=2698826 RepID=UPI0023B0A232|nr:HlyD family secretion protein [Bradyrhizobium sp. CSA207]MDE5443174.1 HlyD family efflux transporter periplasmic adaptor subunit [Bradyrhizobium sp. CSA207]
MIQQLNSIEAESPLPANVQELRPSTDRASVIEPTPVSASPIAWRSRLRRWAAIGAAVALLAGTGWYGWNYWTVGRFLVSTDDAYVKADNTTIAPKVSGYLTDVLVADNEHVTAGHVLARIDDRDFRVALDQAKADVAAAQAVIEGKQAQLDVQQAVIEAAKATIDVDTATKTFASQENKRYTDLAATGYGSVQNAQAAQSRNAGAERIIQRDHANLVSALKRVDLLKAELAQAIAASAHAADLQRQAELNLGYTTITAPIDGVVGDRTLRTGQFVQAGTQLMSLVPATGAYIIANYKETQLTNVHAGQSVNVAVDMFPGQIVHGRVDSLAPASGQEFALLPPDNATGNFTKVVQRIPVKIVLDGGAPIELRPGMSAIPTIETQPHSPALGKASRNSEIADVTRRR